jgi:hypothetical protein
VRAEFSLALALATLDQPDKARLACEAARRLDGLVKNDEELLRHDWLEGRVAARLGEPEAALELLEPVAARLLARGNLAEAALAAVDVAAVLAAMGREGEIGARTAAARDACRFRRGLDAAVTALAELAAPTAATGDGGDGGDAGGVGGVGGVGDPPSLAERASCLGIALRQTLRLRGFRAEPPPAA